MKIRITRGNPATLLFEGSVFHVECVSENGLGKTVYLIRHAGSLVGVVCDDCAVLGDEAVERVRL